jgi:hypothetical protein
MYQSTGFHNNTKQSSAAFGRTNRGNADANGIIRATFAVDF